MKVLQLLAQNGNEPNVLMKRQWSFIKIVLFY